MRKLFKILSKEKSFFALVLVVGIILNFLLTVADPLITKQLYDQGLVNHNFRRFVIIAVTMVLFGTFIRFGLYLQNLLVQKLKNRFIQALSEKMLLGYYNLSYEKAVSQDPGYYLSRVYEEPSKIAVSVVDTVLNGSIFVVNCIGAVIVLAYLSWKLTLFLLLIIPFLFILSTNFRKKITQKSKEENEQEAQVRESIVASIAAYKTVRIFDLSSVVVGKAEAKITDYLKALYDRIKLSNTYLTYSNITMSYAEACVLVSAGFAVVLGKLTLGGLMAFMGAFWKLIGAANNLFALISESSKLTGYIERMFELLEVIPKPRVTTDNRIDFQHGVIGYGDKVVLSDINVSIMPKESCLIVGPNGCGKSTLAMVIAGLMEPLQGVLVRPAESRVSSMLMPFPFIPGSIHDHVKFDGLSQEKQVLFERLVDDFGLRDKIECTSLEGLSAGEKKKVQVIITLLKEADYYIFDEPLSNIDVESKQTIMTAIFNTLKDRSIIMILHGEDAFHDKFDQTILLSGKQINKIPLLEIGEPAVL